MLKQILRPYLFISLCGILAFAPVSFMLLSLKNDIIALEYPVNYYMSQCLRNGEIPVWFNTWGMGFPLQSTLTWGIYSTPQFIFSSTFDYNIYILHLEFLFFILLSGWSMYYLLKQFLVQDKRVSQLLSVCYMLSGFMVGSSQWLLYITAAAFLPLLVASLLKLLRSPSIRNAFQLAVCYTIMFTSVYAAFNIITTYSIIVLSAIWFWQHRKDKKSILQRLSYLFISGLLITALCFPCLYFTLELLNHLDRGASIASDQAFFNSNYLHPEALSSMFFPFSSVRMGFANTEGTMLHTYAGLFLILQLPATIKAGLKRNSRMTLLLGSAAILFLLISFGSMTPVRQAMNVLPGFSYFRNPAIFRLYFIFLLILLTGYALQNQKLEEILAGKYFRFMLWALLSISIVVLLVNMTSLRSFDSFSLTSLIKNINFSKTLVISTIIQALIIIVLIVSIKKKRWAVANLIFTGDLIINTLICTPFFTVSSYTLPEISGILQSKKGFPVQQRSPYNVSSSFEDAKGTIWHNTNVFSKEVAVAESYPGPLVLKNPYAGDGPGDNEGKNSGIVYFHTKDSGSYTLDVIEQKPAHVRAIVQSQNGGSVTLLQNYYPGWRVFINDKAATIIKNQKPGITVVVPAGKNIIDFRYKRPVAWITALLLHAIIILFGLIKLSAVVKKLRYSSPS